MARIRLCYCFTCARVFHGLGIARHRAMHRDRKENCIIQYTNGLIHHHNYATGAL